MKKIALRLIVRQVAKGILTLGRLEPEESFSAGTERNY